MGYIKHQAILFTGYGQGYMEKVHQFVCDTVTSCDLPLSLVSPLAEANVNSTYSFAFFPDGSKEGWNTSDRGDKARDLICDGILSVEKVTGGSWVDWIEVTVSDEHDAPDVTRYGNAPYGYDDDE